MESNMVAPLSSKVDEGAHLRAIELPQPEDHSSFRLELPPWAESYEISSTDGEGRANRPIILINCFLRVYLRQSSIGGGCYG